ncbi:hypothetical protein RA593_004887, partial [Salmonella enterica]|nr:hypothetical protein [Salmonella enterica]
RRKPGLGSRTAFLTRLAPIKRNPALAYWLTEWLEGNSRTPFTPA